MADLTTQDILEHLYQSISQENSRWVLKSTSNYEGGVWYYWNLEPTELVITGVSSKGKIGFFSELAERRHNISVRLSFSGRRKLNQAFEERARKQRHAEEQSKLHHLFQTIVGFTSL